MPANKRHIRSLFVDTQFRAISGVSILVGIARWLEFLAIGIYALDETGSAFLVALLALFRLSPLALFGVFIGSLADHIDTSRLLRVGIVLMAILSILMTVLFVFEFGSYYLVAVATFFSGVCWLCLSYLLLSTKTRLPRQVHREFDPYSRATSFVSSRPGAYTENAGRQFPSTF